MRSGIRPTHANECSDIALPKPVEHTGQILNRLLTAFIKLERAIEAGQRFRESLLPFERQTKIVVRGHVVGTQCHCRAKRPRGFGKSGQLQIAAADKIERLVMSWLQANCVLQRDDRFFDSTTSVQSKAEAE